MISRWDRGRHRRRHDGGGRRSVLAVLLALVAVGGIVTLVALGGRSRGGAAPAPASVAAAPATAALAVQTCRTAVARAHDAVSAAQPSYSHWSGHVHAQLDYDAGTATLAQTRARWASTKATADADLAEFATAYAAFQAVQDGCGGQGSDPDPVVNGCRSELTSASAAVAAGKAVVDDWAAHVTMMKGKEHADPRQYGQMWRDMVRAAPADLDRFEQTSLDLTGHVACPRP
jgi:hypothetical protein